MLVLSLAITVFLTAILVASAAAAKDVSTWIGSSSSGSPGAQFTFPNGVAVNATSGDIYVADTGNNRVQQFSATGSFIRAWGFDVIEPGGTGDLGTNAFEVCTVAANCKAGKSGSVGGFNLGGGLSEPQGIAIDQSNGSVYVTDYRRVQKFSSTGAFQLAFGKNVVQNGKPGDNPPAAAKQTLTVDATGGSYSLTFKGQTTGDIAWNAAPATVQTALQGLSTVGSGNATVSSGGADCTAGCLITFAGALDNSPQPLIVGASSGGDPLSGGASTANVVNTTTGSSGFEVCTVAADCKAGGSSLDGEDVTTAGAFGSGSSPAHIAVAPAGSPNAGRVIVADPGNNRVQEFTSSGAFVDAFGFDVAADPTGTGTGFEVCSAANFDVCKVGTTGSGSGQFAFNSPNRVAVDDAGRIYAIDNNNNRIQRFTSAPAFDTLYATTLASGSPRPTDIAIDPGAVSAGDASDDHVFIVKPFNAGTGTPPAAVSERRILELDTSADPASAIDTHMVGSGINSVEGLGLNTSDESLFVSSTSGGHRVYFLENPLTPPAISLDPITTKTTTTAKFTGTVNPNGGNIACKFQYSTDQVVWTDVTELGCETLSLSGVQGVSEDVPGLKPSTHYFVRLQVTRPFVPGSTVTSEVKVFDTDTALPIVNNVGAVNVQDTSARMVATIDPRGSATGYVFEYGTTPSLGSSTAPVNIGGGTTPKVISQVVGGLKPNTDYFFRAVATNLAGSTASSSATLHTRTDPVPLPDDRGYEQVSPVDKNGGDAFATPGAPEGDFYVSEDGNSATFTATASFGDPAPAMVFRYVAYLTRRTANGWGPARAVQPTFCSHGFQPIFIPHALHFAPDLEHAVLNQPEGRPECQVDPLDPDAPVSTLGANLYRTDLGDPPGFDLLNPNRGTGLPIVPTPQDAGAIYLGASDDQSRIVIGSDGPQTSDSPPYSYGDGYIRIYDWLQLGTSGCTNASPSYNPALEACLSLVSVDPAGNPFTTGSEVPGAFLSGELQNGSGNNDAINAVSATGERIFFQNPSNNLKGPDCRVFTACHLYMRDGGAVTHDVSQSECTASCGSESPDVFQFASPSGDATFFTSAQKLTNSDTSSSGEDLFLYRHSANPASDPNLTAASIDNEPLDGTSAAVQGLVGASDDLETSFFVANGQLVAGAPTAAGPKLYRWLWNSGAPTLQYLATLDAADGNENWVLDPEAPEGTFTYPNARRERRVTPDGGTLILESKAQLNPVADEDSDIDVYRWTAEGGFECVSCQMPGTASGGPSDTGRVGRRFAGAADLNLTNEMSSAISDDGKRIFFQTQDALVAGDTNGPCTFEPLLLFYPCTDVYEWHEGAVSLITPGTSDDEPDVKLIGATSSGSDVFFATREQIVGWDLDTNIDIYDARIGGGFPEPDTQGDICEGEACRGGGSSPASIPGAGSAAFQGPANSGQSTEKNRCPKGKRQVTRRGKARCVPRKKRQSQRQSKRNAKHDRRASR